MPEIVEVKIYADFLKKKIKNQKLQNIIIHKGRYKNHKPPDNYFHLVKNLPIVINNIGTHGKLLYIELENKQYIIITLGLMGGWIYKKKDSLKYSHSANTREFGTRGSENHLNVEFIFVTGSMYFFDTLSFGTIRITDCMGLNGILSGLGPDAMDIRTDQKLFIQQLRKKPNKIIAETLVDQKIISGIGNYLRADILYLAKISPFHTTNSLTDNDLHRIYDVMKFLTWGAYDMKSAKKHGYYKKGMYLPEAYDRLYFIYDQPTDIHGNLVIKQTHNKRSIYYVPEIQK